MMGYAYAIETFLAWYSGDHFERYMALVNRPFGPVRRGVLDDDRLQRAGAAALLVAAAAARSARPLRRLDGDRDRHVDRALRDHRRRRWSADFLPSSWHLYAPTWVDLGILAGTIGLFGVLFLLVLRFVPIVPIHEMKKLRRELREEAGS